MALLDPQLVHPMNTYLNHLWQLEKFEIGLAPYALTSIPKRGAMGALSAYTQIFMARFLTGTVLAVCPPTVTTPSPKWSGRNMLWDNDLHDPGGFHVNMCHMGGTIDTLAVHSMSGVTPCATTTYAIRGFMAWDMHMYMVSGGDPNTVLGPHPPTCCLTLCATPSVHFTCS